MIHLDTSALVEAFVPDTPAAREFESLVAQGDMPSASAIVLFEWPRGPRTRAELTVRMLLIPDERIAACAITHGARLWTLNPQDFTHIPGLSLHVPAGV